jgi:hypothetical protein
MERSANPGVALPAPETLLELKKVVDRVRPLLWIHLNRSGTKRAALSAKDGADPVRRAGAD